MNYYKTGWSVFKKHAENKGYIKKVVGDHAFFNRCGDIIRLKSIKKNVLTIYQEKIGIYFIVL